MKNKNLLSEELKRMKELSGIKVLKEEFEDTTIEDKLSKLLKRAIDLKRGTNPTRTIVNGWEMDNDGEHFTMEKEVTNLITLKLKINTFGYKKWRKPSMEDNIVLNGYSYKLSDIFDKLDENDKIYLVNFINDNAFDYDEGQDSDPYSYYGVSKSDFLNEELKRMHKLSGLIKESEEPSHKEMDFLKQQALKIAQSSEIQNVVNDALSKISDKEKAELFSKLKSAHIVNEQEITEGNISEMNDVMSFDNILNKVFSISGEPLEESETGKNIAKGILKLAGIAISAPAALNAVFGGMPAVMIAQKLGAIATHSTAYNMPQLLTSFGASILLAALGQNLSRIADKIDTDSPQDLEHIKKVQDYYKNINNKINNNSEEWKFNKPI